MAGTITEDLHLKGNGNNLWYSYDYSYMLAAGDSYVYADANDDNEAQKWNIENVTIDVDVIDQIVLHVTDKWNNFTSYAEYSLIINGTETAKQADSSSITFIEQTLTFTGSWTKAALNAGFQLVCTTGSMGSSASFAIDLAYVTIYGYAPTTTGNIAIAAQVM